MLHSGFGTCTTVPLLTIFEVNYKQIHYMASRLRSSSGEKPDMRLLPTLCTYIYGVGNKQENPSRVTVRSECGVVSLLVNKTSIPWEGAPWPMAPINVDSEWMLIVYLLHELCVYQAQLHPKWKGRLECTQTYQLVLP